MDKQTEGRLKTGAAMALASLMVLAGCGASQPSADASEVGEVRPEPVNGWVELPLGEHTLSKQPQGWRTDVVEIPVPGGGGELEYKFALQKGQGFVYSISYGDLVYADEFAVEFHGHTEKGPDGIGDLMFYSVTEGVAENGVFSAPFDGDHGWYLKNDSAEEVTVRIELAGFYDVVGTIELGGDEDE